MKLEMLHKTPHMDQLSSGVFVFRDGGNNLLINSNGYILLMDDELYQEFLQWNLTDGLLRKLKNKGFLNDKCQLEEIKLLPEFFMIDLTNKCNLRCKYCFRNIETCNTSITPEVFDDICDYITKYCDQYNVKDISVQAWGGEPLLEKDLVFRIRARIRPQKTKVHFSVETNGTLLSEKMVKELYENKIGIGISIDGRENDQNAQRVFLNGKGSFAQVAAGVKRTIGKYGNSIGTITTITRNNYQNVEAILDFYAKELRLKNLKFNFVHRSTFAYNDNLCLSVEEIQETEIRIFDKLVYLVKEGYNIFDSNIKTKIRNVLQREYSDVCLSRGCCGGRKMIVFDMNGGIYPCELTDYKEQKIGTIYENPDLPLLLQERKKTSLFYRKKFQDKCGKCPWYFFCRGGCTVRMMNSGTETADIDEIECAVNTALYPKIIELILNDIDLAYQILEI
mgnify:FL=1